MKLPIFSSENRSTYRVAMEGNQGTLWIGLPSGPMKVNLDDLSARGCGFTLDAESGLTLAEGSELTLRLKVGPETSPQLFIRSEIRVLRPHADKVRVGVAFKDCERLYQQLDEPQWIYFNRRRAFRIVPADQRGEALTANFYDYDSSEELYFELLDLSASGLAIRIPRGKEFTLSKTRPVRAIFELSGIEQPFDLALNYVHSTAFRGVERVGMKYDPVATKGFEAQAERILGYVLDRRNQLLRR